MSKQVVGLLLLVAVVVGGLAGCGATREVLSVPGLAPQPVVVERAAVTDAYGKGGEAQSAYSGEGPAVERMVIWNASISLKVKDTEVAIEQVQAVARDLGGYTIGTESWLVDDQLQARLTIRVPAERFEEAMARLRDLALKVNRESSNSEDVTDQYVDLQSRLRHLEAKEVQLLKFLEDAEDTEAVLAVYEQLSQTQGEIEQVKGRMAYLEKLSAMATITAELYPEEVEPPLVEEGWKPLRTLRDAARGLVRALQSLGDAVIWFVVYLLPILLLLALPVLLVVWLVRRAMRRRRAKG